MPLRPQPVGETGRERRLGSHDRQPHVLLGDERGDRGGVAWARVDRATEGFHPRVSRGEQVVVLGVIPTELPEEGVLAAPVADDEDLHEIEASA